MESSSVLGHADYGVRKGQRAVTPCRVGIGARSQAHCRPQPPAKCESIMSASWSAVWKPLIFWLPT